MDRPGDVLRAADATDAADAADGVIAAKPSKRDWEAAERLTDSLLR
ncbi:hypothetical protein [Streptomyces puniciscabiei]|nr:hypothetical protein [Streptomyces puniciscabiei]